MKDEDVSVAYREFERIEARFIELTDFIPLVPKLNAPNYCVASPRAAAFGIDCLTWFETLLKEFVTDARFDGLKGIQQARKAKALPGYWEFCVNSLRWNQKRWILVDQKEVEIEPFGEWKKESTPLWFQKYSKLKHHRLSLAKSFKMLDAMNAFAALFTIVQTWERPTFVEPGFSRVLGEPPPRMMDVSGFF